MEAGTGPASCRILVVNDDPASLLALCGLLAAGEESSGWQIMSARSGKEALQQVLLHDFAVILLDVDMPDMDGFETAEAIHRQWRSAQVPIIFVTACLLDDMHRLKGYQKGAVDYLLTPVIPQILRAKVAVFVALSRKNLQLEHQARVLQQRSNELIATNARLTEEIEERRLAEQQNRAKDEFLAMLGHELRNPLNAIASAAAVLQHADRESRSHAAAIVQRQSRHLAHIVDDLLDIGRVMSRKIILARRRLNMRTVLDNCLDTLASCGRLGSHELTVDASDVWVDADPTRMEQVITNLLDNAIKYTPDVGRIRVQLQESAGQAELEISDSGVGISAELLPHVFDVFVQGKRSLDRAGGGLGIGLALVRQLVQLHGGHISAESQGHGLGSVFRVQLPAVAPPPEQIRSLPSAAPAAVHRVLLIDDNEDGVDMLRLLLGSMGFQVSQASDGPSGLQLALEQRPQAALVDIGLPGMDGYEVARRLRSDPRTCNVRLVAVTGYGLADDVRRALEAGFDHHLVKPVDIDLLLQALQP